MRVESSVVKNEVFINEEGTHRYLLKRVWKSEPKSLVAVLTLKPVSINSLESDLTTMLIQNHVVEMGYDGFVAINLVSGIRQTNAISASLMDKEVEDEILKEVLNTKEVQKIVIGSGSTIASKGFPQDRLKEILNLLTKQNQEKVVVIVDDEDKPIHPLVPSIRNQPWQLKKIKF